MAGQAAAAPSTSVQTGDVTRGGNADTITVGGGSCNPVGGGGGGGGGIGPQSTGGCYGSAGAAGSSGGQSVAGATLIGSPTITVGTGAGAAGQNGADGSITFKTCFTGAWPTKVTGYPTLPASGQAPIGYFAGVSGDNWTVYSHNDTSTKVIYSGNITALCPFSNVAGLQTNSADSVKVSANGRVITFQFVTHNESDGVQFTSGCTKQVVMNLYISGHVAPLSEVYVGNPTTHPTSAPETFTRSS
jgi:hypothetical protein